MSKRLIYLAVFGTTLFGYATQGKDAWAGSWALFLSLITLVSAAFLYRRTSLICAVTYAYCMGQAVGVFMGYSNISLMPNQILMFDKLSAIFAFSLSLMVFVFVSLDIKGLKYFENCFMTLCFADSALVLFQKFTGVSTGGFFINESMNGCFIAMTYPLLVMAPEKISYHLKPLTFKSSDLMQAGFDFVCTLMPIIALFSAKASSPILAMSIVWFLHYLLYGKHINGLSTLSRRITMSCSVVGVMFVIALWKFPNFVHDSGRLNMWQSFLEWFLQGGHLWRGEGPGSFFLWGPHVQTISGLNDGNWFVWAHNEFLQTGIEFGVIGLSLLVALIFEASYRAFKRESLHYVLISLVTYCFVAFVNWPLRQPITMCFGCYLLARIYREDYLAKRMAELEAKN